jgi:hypothetical protein
LPPILSLSTGWNLISLPLQQTNAAPATVLSSMTGSYDVVWGYSNQTWEFYDPNDQSGSTLTAMQAEMGYWIDMTSTGTLTVFG